MVCLLVAATASGGVQGGLILVVHERQKGRSVELMRFHGNNVVICGVVSGVHRTLPIRAYPPRPFTLKYLSDLEESLFQFGNHDPIIMGDLNVDTEKA